MFRRIQPVLILLLAAVASWLATMAVHELGHVLHALLSGGRVERVVLHPLAFSRTDLAENPHPTFVAWGGALWGTAVPLGVWLAMRKARLACLLRFFAGFALVANGAYLAAAIVLPVGDTEDLVRLGVSPLLLLAAGLPMVAAGLALWSGVGRRFGFGDLPPEPGALPAAAASLIVLAGVLIIWSVRPW